MAAELRSCSIPMLAVLGNHDHQCGTPQDVEKVLCDAGVKLLENEVHNVAAHVPKPTGKPYSLIEISR